MPLHQCAGAFKKVFQSLPMLSNHICVYISQKEMLNNFELFANTTEKSQFQQECVWLLIHLRWQPLLFIIKVKMYCNENIMHIDFIPEIAI